MLHLALALCVLNDAYREAERLGVKLEGVAIEAAGIIDDQWRSADIQHRVALDSSPPGWRRAGRHQTSRWNRCRALSCSSVS